MGVGGGVDATREAGEQLAAGLLFQGADLRGHRGLGQAEPGGGGGEGAGAVDGQEGAQQIEVRVRRKLLADGRRPGGLLARGARLVVHDAKGIGFRHRDSDTWNRLTYW